MRMITKHLVLPVIEIGRTIGNRTQLIFAPNEAHLFQSAFVRYCDNVHPLHFESYTLLARIMPNRTAPLSEFIKLVMLGGVEPANKILKVSCADHYTIAS